MIQVEKISADIYTSCYIFYEILFFMTSIKHYYLLKTKVSGFISPIFCIIGVLGGLKLGSSTFFSTAKGVTIDTSEFSNTQRWYSIVFRVSSLKSIPKAHCKYFSGILP